MYFLSIDSQGLGGGKEWQKYGFYCRFVQVIKN
jgi:hypothetical protein